MQMLAANGCRQTPARRMIVDILLESPRALEPLEVFSTGRDRLVHLGLVTVYRTLEKLEELGLVQRVHHPGGCNLYMRAASTHEHLLICTRCGKAEYFSGDNLSALMTETTRKTGYTITDHWLQLFGTCPACAGLDGQNHA
jgi:Fe2+ or Zn2+ uptake regulation protein